jgi:transglutaminase-like putative cysteine protease
VRRLSVEIADLAPGTRLLAPVGMASPGEAVTGASVTGGRIAAILPEPGLGLAALEIEAEGGRLTLHHEIARGAYGYPEIVFAPRATRYTTAADDLAQTSREVARAAGGGLAGIAALVAEAEARFAYAHPEHRFNDGTEAVPYLACGTTPGSCVDINTYLVASLRAAGFEAGYVYGYFFPAEKGGVTHDMHCWVVTRQGGEMQHWDIAHHMKAGLGPTRPGLNPHPGWRVALGHSMGHAYGQGAGAVRLKLLAEPVARGDGGGVRDLPVVARLAAP